MESFSGKMKHEEVKLYEYEIHQDVVTRFLYFLDEVHSQKRLHSVIGTCHHGGGISS
jgi:hypothetical protein